MGVLPMNRGVFADHQHVNSFDEEYAELAERHERSPEWLRAFSIAVAALNLPWGARVLDVGCNTGHGVDLLTQNFHLQGEGCDVNLAALRRARSREPDAKFWDCRGADGWVERMGRYDGAILVNVLGHSSNPERLIHNVSLVLKEASRFVVVNPNLWHHRSMVVPNLVTGYRSDPTLRRMWTPGRLIEFLFAHGLQPRKVEMAGRHALGLPGRCLRPTMIISGERLL